MAMLEGTLVLDLSSVGPAARAGRWLADYGATVVKVGPVPARDGVLITPPFHAYGGHREMQRFLVDLKAAEGRAAFLRLATVADVVLESFRPGVVDRLGIGPKDVHARNPGLVYCSTTGFGQDGPQASWAGHDLNYLAMSGFLASTQPAAGGAPPLPGATVADSAAGGLHAVVAILAALVRRSRTGQGAHLDVAVADGMLALMALQLDEHFATGVSPGFGHDLLTGRFACYGIYGTRDGKWVAVAAIEPRFWANLCTALGLDRWIAHQTDDARQDAIRADLREAFSHADRDEWTDRLAPADTCVSPVLSVDEVAASPHYAARGAFVTAVHPDHGEVRQVGPVLAGGCAPDGGYRLRRAGETDTDALLLAAGLSAAECDELRRNGAVA